MRVALVVVMVAVLSSVAYADGAIVVVVDRAMSADKIATVTHALTENLDAFDAADDIAIVSYAKTAHVDLALQSVSHRDRVSSAVATIRTAKDSDLAAGLRAANDVLAHTKRLHKYVLVISEDGPHTRFEAALDKLRKQNVQVSALGYQTGTALNALAANGGAAYSIRHANEFARAFASAATVPPPDDVAVVVLIDRNGTMRKNLDIAKTIAGTILAVLTPTDTFAVVGFDSEAQTIVRPQHAVSKTAIVEGIDRLQPGVGTNYYVGLKAAYELLSAESTAQKHVILIGDGEAPSDGISELAAEMHRAGINITVVGVAGSDRNVLMRIADEADGRFYMTDDVGQLPRIFLRETAH